MSLLFSSFASCKLMSLAVSPASSPSQVSLRPLRELIFFGYCLGIGIVMRIPFLWRWPRRCFLLDDRLIDLVQQSSVVDQLSTPPDHDQAVAQFDAVRLAGGDIDFGFLQNRSDLGIAFELDHNILEYLRCRALRYGIVELA